MICPSCGSDYKGILGLSTHIGKSDCELPDLTRPEKNIAIGVLMGDGTINRGSLQMQNTNKRYVMWLKSQFETVNVNVSYADSRGENLSPIWTLNTSAHEYFKGMESWYNSGQKRYPDDLSLTPIILNNWYSCDGGIVNNGYSARIYCKNEIDRVDFLYRIFDDIDIYPTIYTSDSRCEIDFRSDEKSKLFDYMGSPLPGMSYKWEVDW